MNKKVVLLAGLPGVGKSTLARKIANKECGLVLDIDEIKRKIVDPKLVTSTIDPPEVRWRCYEEAAEKVFFLLEKGASTIIMDEVFHLAILRQKLEELFLQKGIEVFWLEVRCSHVEVERRLREKSRNGHILSTDEALKMNLLFEGIFERFPEGKKNHIIFRNEAGCDFEKLAFNP